MNNLPGPQTKKWCQVDLAAPRRPGGVLLPGVDEEWGPLRWLESHTERRETYGWDCFGGRSIITKMNDALIKQMLECPGVTITPLAPTGVYTVRLVSLVRDEEGQTAQLTDQRLMQALKMQTEVKHGPTSLAQEIQETKERLFRSRAAWPALKSHIHDAIQKHDSSAPFRIYDKSCLILVKTHVESLAEALKAIKDADVTEMIPGKSLKRLLRSCRSSELTSKDILGGEFENPQPGLRVSRSSATFTP